MSYRSTGKAIDILLIEDNPGDVCLTHEALRFGKVKNNLTVIDNGADAMALLRREGRYRNTQRPDLVLLDLNIPRLSGMEVLKEIKTDPRLKIIPVVILTTSQSEEDIIRAYNLNANCYITKPVDLEQFLKVVKTIEEFWFTIVKLPKGDEDD
jgi:two-component system, chemotaxis family, response regulator Rcp1